MKKPITPLMLLLALLVSFNAFSLPVLNSLPSAKATIYLDFDGHTINCAYWNNGTPFTCDASGMTDAQITEIFNRVAEDYRPFDINITTDEAAFMEAPLSQRIRILITPTSAWYPGVAGISHVGSFTWGDDAPAFVFSDRLGPNNPKMVAECCSHESGHSLGLYHHATYDSTCNLTSVYDGGKGTGITGWAPIMGNSYYRNLSGWGNGPTPYGCNTSQDDLSVITGQNGFTYRTDDYSDDINDNPGIFALADINVGGIISSGTDKDAFTFNLSKHSSIHIDVKPFSIDSTYQGADLDVKVSLYNASHELVKIYDPQETIDVVIDTTLEAGAWYIVIDGAGNGNEADYGSLGAYSIKSSAVPIPPMLTVVLTGKDEQNEHILNWNIQSDEHVKLITVESSDDNLHFNAVNTISGVASDFIYTPLEKNDLYYRVKATSISNNTNYSNTIMLKGVRKPERLFKVSTLIHNELTVTASQDYQYMVYDLTGNSVVRGGGKAGLNKLDMSRMPGGIYVLQLLGNDQKQTERIIKQ